MSAEALLERLQSVSKQADGRWRARCPACGGGNSQKLAVRELSDGTVLLKCFGGCGAADIIGSVGLNFADLFPSDHRAPSDPRRAGKPNMWHAQREALRAVHREALLCAIAAEDIAAGRSLSHEDVARVSTAAGRIRSAIEACR